MKCLIGKGGRAGPGRGERERFKMTNATKRETLAQLLIARVEDGRGNLLIDTWEPGKAHLAAECLLAYKTD